MKTEIILNFYNTKGKKFWSREFDDLTSAHRFASSSEGFDCQVTYEETEGKAYANIEEYRDGEHHNDIYLVAEYEPNESFTSWDRKYLGK